VYTVSYPGTDKKHITAEYCGKLLRKRIEEEGKEEEEEEEEEEGKKRNPRGMTLFERLQLKSVSEMVIEEILHRVYLGDLSVGQKLPPERVMADEMGISRTSLRKALHEMEKSGHINSLAGNGNFVIDPLVMTRLPSIFASFKEDPQLLTSDIIEMRIPLETHIAKLAALNAKANQIDKIEETLITMKKTIENGGCEIGRAHV
jgi:DNA-binding FadR family transcriptional regulator